ncbi:MAG: hypothetical protein AB7S88_03635, partial [Candidatus Izemoplasmatales bacterium]
PMQSLMKKAMMLILSMAAVFAATGCKTDTTTTTTTFTGETPTLSNPDDVFFQGDGYDITYGEIYDELKINDGINRLLFMIDEIILADELAAVTDAQIQEKALYLTYGTSDADEIAGLTDQERADAEKTYADNMTLLGYQNHEEDYIRMVVAKEVAATNMMYDETYNDQSWYVGPSTIASYYASTYYEDLASIKIRFFSQTDANNVMKHFNLINYNGAIRLYTGTKPIDQVLSTSFNDTNTVALTNEEIIVKFVEMYNYVYGDYRDPVATDLSTDQYTNLDAFQVNYLDLTDVSSTLATYAFKTLGALNLYEDNASSTLFYTASPVKYYGSADTSYYLILNLNRADKVDVSNFDGDEAALVNLIGQATYDDIAARLEETNLTTSGFISNRIADLREANELVIYDYYLGIDYQSVDAAYVLNEEGNASIVASITGHEITADDLLTSAMSLNAPVYVMTAAQTAVVLGEYFDTVYCDDDTVACNTSIADNTSAKMEEHRAALEDLRASFEASYYVYYYTFQEYVYLAYGAKSDDDMILKYYVKSTLQPYLVYNEIQSNDWAVLTEYLVPLVEEYYNNYFSLNVDHLLIYVDRDENGSPDDYADFYASLEDQAAYDSLFADFQAAIRNYLADTDNTFTDLISVYTKASREDAVWGPYVSYGFYLLTEDLSSSASLTYLTSKDTYETPFVDALVQTYIEYNLDQNINETGLYYSGIAETSYGVHIIYATKGSDFAKPSAKFTMTYTNNEPNYSEGIANSSDELSLEQLKLYVEYRFDTIVYGTDADAEETYNFTLPVIPTSVMDALESYFADLNDSLYVVGYLNVIIAAKLEAGTISNTHSAYCDWTSDAIKARLAEVSDIYLDSVFPAPTK